MCCTWKRLLVWACVACGPGVARAAPQADLPPGPAERGPVLEMTEENDCVAGTDRHYTQGARIVYLDAESSQPHWLKDVAALDLRVDTWRWGFELGQSLFTPENLEAAYPLPHDRPYAGWLYAGPVLQRRGVTPGLGVPALENLQLQLGVVGPGAMAKEEQNAAHFVGGFGVAEGWRYQLGNEPGCALKYQRAWRLAPGGPRDWSVEMLPHVGGSLGNVDTSARIGTTLRGGWHLPDDFGVQTIDSLGVADGGCFAATPQRRFGWYLFARAEERAVGYNEFLDGNVIRNTGYNEYLDGKLVWVSPHVAKRPFVCELQGGLVLVFARLDFAFTMVYRSREFYGQDGEDAFGSLSLRVMF